MCGDNAILGGQRQGLQVWFQLKDSIWTMRVDVKNEIVFDSC
jgi:hypothetical protein